MPFQFPCPHCGAENDATGQNVGQNVPCARCGNEINVLCKPARKVSFSFGSWKLFVCFFGGLILIDIIGIGMSLLLPAVQAAREAVRREHCSNNLHCIALAMLNYHDKYGRFPPAFIPDENGKPMRSWRVLLLPYFEPHSRDPQYRFDEPWDSPNNRNVSDEVIRLYQCPSQPDTKQPRQPTTNYMMVVGPHTISDGVHSRKLADITDGAANTIMIVEVADSDVHWAEPKDLNFDELDFKINSGKRPGISSHHRGGVNVIFCDGHQQFISAQMKPETIKALLTIDGGEKISDGEF